MQRPIEVPFELERIRGLPGGAAWLDGLPSLVETMARTWSLDIGAPFRGACTSFAAPCVAAGKGEAVLKLPFPDRESRYEADALRRWNGNGAVRLLRHHPETRAMLLERCRPGAPLADADPEQALEVFVDLLPRLWVPRGDPVGSLVEEAAGWAERLPATWERARRPFERRLVDAALDAIDKLAGTQGEQVLVHQDLHAGNVLAAEREPWLVIDPKPLIGEQAFGLAPIVRGPELGHSRKQVIHRLDRLSAELGVDRERTRLWTLAQTVAWCFEGRRALPSHVDVARWLVE